MNINATAKATIAKTELRMELRPANPKMSMQEALDKFHAASPENKAIDYGDDKDVVILGAHDKSRTVAYEFVPELSPPGFTIQMAMEHMKKAGYDVRGLSDDGKRIIVCEKEI